MKIIIERIIIVNRLLRNTFALSSLTIEVADFRNMLYLPNRHRDKL